MVITASHKHKKCVLFQRTFPFGTFQTLKENTKYSYVFSGPSRPSNFVGMEYSKRVGDLFISNFYTSSPSFSLLCCIEGNIKSHKKTYLQRLQCVNNRQYSRRYSPKGVDKKGRGGGVKLHLPLLQAIIIYIFFIDLTSVFSFNRSNFNILTKCKCMTNDRLSRFLEISQSVQLFSAIRMS